MLSEHENGVPLETAFTGDVIPPGKDSQHSDEQIIRRIVAGDRELFRELVRRHRSLVFASIMRQVGERSLAEELAQETFVRAFTGLPGFRSESRFSTWIVRIAINTTSSYFSSRAFREKKRTTEFDPASHDTKAGTADEERREKQIRFERFREALTQLPLKQREVLVLCGIEERPYEEAASLLGIPVGTVRSRLNKARLMMRALIAEADGEGEQ